MMKQLQLIANLLTPKRIFLGGTCNNSPWRDKLIPQLTADYFNPVVEDWTEECQKREIEERESCDICLYVITPKMKGTYSIAEVVDDSNKRPEKTVFCIVKKDGENTFGEQEYKSLKQVLKLVEDNNSKAFDLENIDTLKPLASYLNSN